MITVKLHYYFLISIYLIKLEMYFNLIRYIWINSSTPLELVNFNWSLSSVYFLGTNRVLPYDTSENLVKKSLVYLHFRFMG